MTVTPAPDWTRSELHRLERMLARGLTPPQMAAAFPGRSVHAVRARITALRIGALKSGGFRFLSSRNRWTPEKIERLHVLLGERRQLGEVAGILGHSKKSCQQKASQLGIRVPRGRPPMQKCIPTMQKPEAPRHHQPWTKEEEQRLLALVAHPSRLSHAEIGARLNRTAVSVEVRLKALSRGVVGAKKSEGSRRPCLCCRRLFNSQGPGNRLCKNCRTTSVSPFEI